LQSFKSTPSKAFVKKLLPQNMLFIPKSFVWQAIAITTAQRKTGGSGEATTRFEEMRVLPFFFLRFYNQRYSNYVIFKQAVLVFPVALFFKKLTCNKG
jgi:hypothetical protein